MVEDSSSIVFGERSLTKVAGVYPTRDAAEAARARLIGGGWPAARVVLLAPEDARMSRRGLLARKVEPEPRGIWKTIVRAHVVAGVAGLAAGVVIWGALLATGNVLVASSRVVSFIAIVFITTALGLMAGGVIALRPDHARLITELRSALREGRFAVIAHPTDGVQVERAQVALAAGADHVTHTL